MIERFLHVSYDEFAGRAATLVTFLPLLAERFARQRLRAAARIEGNSGDGGPVVPFLCLHKAGLQMALGFFAHHAGDRAAGWSGGSEPCDQVNTAAVRAMAEIGIDISQGCRLNHHTRTVRKRIGIQRSGQSSMTARPRRFRSANPSRMACTCSSVWPTQSTSSSRTFTGSRVR